MYETVTELDEKLVPRSWFSIALFLTSSKDLVLTRNKICIAISSFINNFFIFHYLEGKGNSFLNICYVVAGLTELPISISIYVNNRSTFRNVLLTPYPS